MNKHWLLLYLSVIFLPVYSSDKVRIKIISPENKRILQGEEIVSSFSYFKFNDGQCSTCSFVTAIVNLVPIIFPLTVTLFKLGMGDSISSNIAVPGYLIIASTTCSAVNLILYCKYRYGIFKKACELEKLAKQYIDQ